MATSVVDMPKSQKKKVFTARMDPVEHRRIALMIKEAGSTQDRFLLDAVYEKLKRGRVELTDVGVTRDLNPEDRAAVQWIADVLRDQADNTLLREVLGQHQVILRLLCK
jgi:hypothetical protein